MKQLICFTVSETSVTENPPHPGLSLRHLSRKLTHSRDSAVLNAYGYVVLSFQRPLATLGFATCQGTTLCQADTTLMDPIFRWGLQQRMGFAAPGQEKLVVALQGESVVRDRNALVARQAGLTAQTEQNMFIPGWTQEDGEPAPGGVRPIHRADAHIIKPSGAELWLDVRIRTVGPGLPIARELRREEETKCRDYSQRHGYDLNKLDKGMIPGFMEQYGSRPPGPTPFSRSSSSTALSSLSDKGWLPTPLPNVKPALACGRHWLASCSEQRGNHWQNACPHKSRQDRRTAHTRQGQNTPPPRPSLRRTFLLLTRCPPQRWQHDGQPLGSSLV